MPRFRVVNAVWGEEFTSFFLKLNLSSELSPANLPSLARAGSLEYVIYTTKKDRASIEGSAEFARLRNIARVSFVDIEALPESVFSGTQSRMAACHAHFIDSSRDCADYMIFSAPDHIVAEGSYSALARHAAEGKDLVVLSTFRLLKQGVLSELSVRNLGTQLAERGIAPRQLVDIALRNLHPITKSLFWNSESFNGWPSIMFWPVGEEGLIVRQWHLHPLMAKVGDFPSSSKNSLDADFVVDACPDIGKLHIVRDSDEICVFELSDLDKQVTPAAYGIHRIPSVAGWAQGSSNSRHREFVKQEIFIHRGELGPEWLEPRREAERIVSTIMKLLQDNSGSSLTGLEQTGNIRSDVRSRGVDVVLLCENENDELEILSALDEIEKQSLTCNKVIVVGREIPGLAVECVRDLPAALKAVDGSYVFFHRVGWELNRDFLRRLISLMEQHPNLSVSLSSVLARVNDDLEVSAKERGEWAKMAEKFTIYSATNTLMRGAVKPEDFLNNLLGYRAPFLDRRIYGAVYRADLVQYLAEHASLGELFLPFMFLLGSLSEGVGFIPEPLLEARRDYWSSIMDETQLLNDERRDKLNLALCLIAQSSGLKEFRERMMKVLRFLASPTEILSLLATDPRLKSLCSKTTFENVALSDAFESAMLSSPKILHRLFETYAAEKTQEESLAELLKEAERLSGAGDYKAAEPLLIQVLITDPSNLTAFFILARCALLRNNIPEAVVAIENAARVAPDDQEVLARAGAFYTSLGMFREAKRHLGKLLAISPNHVTAHNAMAVSLMGEGDNETAVLHLDIAMVADPGNPELLANYALANINLNRLNRAIPALEQASRINPGNHKVKELCRIAQELQAGAVA